MVKTQILNDGTGKCARIKAFVEIITEVEFFDIFKLAAVYPLDYLARLTKFARLWIETLYSEG